MTPIDSAKVGDAVGRRIGPIQEVGTLGVGSELVLDGEERREGTRKAGVGDSLQAALPETVFGEASAKCLPRQVGEALEVVASECRGETDEGAALLVEMVTRVETVQKVGIGHAQSIVALILFFLLLPGCDGKVRRFEEANPLPLSRAYGRDPIPLPGGGSVPRARFQAHVARRLGSNWMSYLALDKALAAEIRDRGLPPPDLDLRARMRGLVRSGLLEEWLPKRRGSYRAEKAELDLARTLADLLVVTGKRDLDRRALTACFVREIRRRAPQLPKQGDEILATCQGQEVHVLEVYPELSALIPAAERNELLYELAPSRYAPGREEPR